eukprot:scaffold277731_cov30-Tisochrysis_lutea.AAC.5
MAPQKGGYPARFSLLINSLGASALVMGTPWGLAMKLHKRANRPGACLTFRKAASCSSLNSEITSRRKPTARDERV